MTTTSPNILNTLVGFSGLQHQSLMNTFAIAGGTTEIDTLNLGKSGTAGTLNVFPGTATTGKIVYTATANSGNYTIGITNAAFGQASTLTIPDPGAATAKFALDGYTNVFTAAQQINTLNVGASGTAGSVNLFSGTASKGKWLFTPVDNTGNTTMTITNAAQAGAYTYTIPSVGANANFLFNNNGTGTESANAVTINNLSGVITTSSLSTAGGSSYVITLTNSFIASTSKVIVNIAGGSNTNTFNISHKTVSGSGSAVITIYNNTAATALNGTLLLNFFVIP
jgi:hypothetical protein